MQKRVNLLFIIGIFTILHSCMNTKQYSVNQTAYLGVQSNQTTIYTDKESDCFYSPFSLDISPMEKLMLIDFKGDSLYETIELQVFDDYRGKGAAVILYGKNGMNDVYFTDSVFVNLALFQGHLSIDKHIAYSLQTTDSGLDAYVKLKDKLGRKIEVKVKERSNKSPKTSFLAPIGGIIKTFTFFPLFYMEDFNFVKRSGTALTVTINNKALQASKIPILLNGSFVYLSRYSTKPVICCVNEQYTGELKPLFPLKDYSCKDGNMNYTLVNNNGHLEINKINCNDSKSNVSVTFSPSIPDLINLKNGAKISGKFSFEVDCISGIVAGEYQIVRTNENLSISMSPKEAYSPMNGHLWVLSYKWIANMQFHENGKVTMQSKWINSSSI